MHASLLGITVFQSVIAILVGLVYVAIQLALGWESHQKYGTGYYWVGADLVGAVIGYANYRYWTSLVTSGSTDYPVYVMIPISFFLSLIGLWAFLIYYAIMLKRHKEYRAGSRMERKMFATEQAATGTGRFRELLQGWEGDMKLDALIVEGKFDEAEDYLEGVILASASERDLIKARFYEHYRKVIMRERLFFEESKEFRTGEDADKKRIAEKAFETPEFGKEKELKQEDMPEGWQLPE